MMGFLLNKLHQDVILTDISHLIVLETEFVERALHYSLLVHGFDTFGTEGVSTSQRERAFPSEVVRLIADVALILILLSLSVNIEVLLVLLLDYICFQFLLKASAPDADEFHWGQVSLMAEGVEA
jgi:hypothetical protein